MSSFLYQSPLVNREEGNNEDDLIGGVWRGIVDDDTVDCNERKLIYKLNTDEVRNIWANPNPMKVDLKIPVPTPREDKPVPFESPYFQGIQEGPCEGHLECVKAILETINAPPRQTLLHRTPPFSYMFWTEYDWVWMCSILQTLPECYPYVMRLQMAEYPKYSSIRHAQMDSWLRYKWAQKASKQLSDSSSSSHVEYVYTPGYFDYHGDNIVKGTSEQGQHHETA